MFCACLLFVSSNSEECYKMESSHNERTTINMEDVFFKMLFVSKRVFDILPSKKPKTQIRNEFQKIAGEKTRRTNKMEKHDRILLKKMFMRQMKETWESQLN